MMNKLGSGKHFATDMVTLFEQVTVNGREVKTEVQDFANEVIVTHAMTAFRANAARSVAHYYFITRYALDLANFIYIEESKEAGMDYRSDAMANKKQQGFVKDNLWVFARLLGVYGDKVDNLRGRMSDLSPAVLPKDSVDDVIAIYGQRGVDIFDNIPNGFIGSPIYSVRLVFAQWEADRYIHLKDKKRLLELRVLHLRMLKEQGQSDANMEKELGYIQQRVTDIDYKIAKIEEDVS
jgi:hypothetical protein